MTHTEQRILRHSSQFTNSKEPYEVVDGVDDFVAVSTAAEHHQSIL